MVWVMKTFLIASLLSLVLSETSEKDPYTKYKFRFDTADNGQHTRIEESNAPGHVSGMYSYMDPNRELRIFRYKSSPGVGYQVYGDEITKFGPGLAPDASIDDHSAVIPSSKTAATGEVISVDADSFSKPQIEKEKNDSEVSESKELSPNATENLVQMFEKTLVSEIVSTTMQSLQILKDNSSEEISENNDLNEFVTESFPVDSKNLIMPVSESVSKAEGILNDTHSLLIGITNSSVFETNDNYTSSDKEVVIEVPKAEYPPASTSVYVNHNRLLPYLFPFTSYKFPVNSLPLVYAFPNAFTYNILAPHYQLIRL